MSVAIPGAVPAPQGVSRTDADVANSQPAVWSNKFFVSMGSVLKIAFLEQGGPTEPVFFRTAAVMSVQDAIALKNLLVGLLAEPERQIQAFQEQQVAAQEKPANG
jgi:hypothetical protein